MSRFFRTSMNVDGIPMSYDLINYFRDAGAVDFYHDLIGQSRFVACFARNALPVARYDSLVKTVDERLVIFRAMLKFYINKTTLPVHQDLIVKLGQFNPGGRVAAYLLYYSELALSYPCKVRGAALELFLDDDLERFSVFFPHVSPRDLVNMMHEAESEILTLE